MEQSEAVAQPPTEWGKNLRCCMVCRLMKTFEQFYDQGCENCPYLAMEGDRERIFDCTTTEFQVGRTRLSLPLWWSPGSRPTSRCSLVWTTGWFSSLIENLASITHWHSDTCNED